MNTSSGRFGLRFVVGFLILMGAFEASRGTAFEEFIVREMILAPTTSLIDWVTPRENVTLADRTLVSPDGADLRVTRGCEGIEMFLLLIAAVLAFPATLRHRVHGLLVGGLLAYFLSIARLMALHYVLRYAPQTWDALHGLVLPLAPIILLSLYFLRWTAAPPQASSSEPPAHAA
jgi:exosortase family protein XrtM